MSLQCEPCGGAGDFVMAIQSTPGPVALASNAEEVVNQGVCQTMQEAALRSDVRLLCIMGGW